MVLSNQILNDKKPKKYSVFSLVRNALSYHENWQPAWRSPEIKKL